MILAAQTAAAQDKTFPVVDTMQDRCFDLAGDAIVCPATDETLNGQDAQYSRTASDHTDNADGAVSDATTGLMWQQSDDGTRREWAEALAYCEALDLGGYADWHGSGAQRSSIKTLTDQALTDEDTCSINACDVDRPDNLVRCVR